MDISSFQEFQVVQLIEKHFKLSVPFSLENLTSCFRKACKKCHPDLGGDAEIFKVISSLYSHVLENKLRFSYLFTDHITVIGLVTTQGDLLDDLGKGLGQMVNGSKCASCDHKGYTENCAQAWSKCISCEGRGRIIYKQNCLSCSGSGKFTQARSRRIVNCLTCHGSGFTNRPGINLCFKCWGSGELPSKGMIVSYNTCYACKGSGETRMFNPVLRKGVLG